MRPRVEWIRVGDLDVLQYLDAHELDDFQQPPTVIAQNTGNSDSYVRDRVRVLRKIGLIERTDKQRGYYKLTDLGHRFLTGNLTDHELSRLREFDADDA